MIDPSEQNSHIYPDLIQAEMYVASENPVSNLTTHCDSTKFTLLNSDYPKTNHAIMREKLR